MKENGKMVNFMGMEFINSLMEVNIKVNGKKESLMALGNLVILKIKNILDFLKGIKDRDLVLKFGWIIKKPLLAFGKIIQWMVWENL